MKKSTKIYLKTFLISSVCFFVFTTFGFLYLNSKTQVNVQKEEYSVPYYSTQQNAGVMFDLAGKYTYLYLDFEGGSLYLLYADDYDGTSEEIYGYPINYTVKSDFDLVAWFVDAVGGVELEMGGEKLDFTGAQVKELITTTADYSSVKRTVTEKIIEEIANNGFLRQDLLYIIENSETNLTIPDCYYWSDDIQKLCKNLRVIN